MAEFPCLPLWTDALLGDTYHLTPAQFGAYLRLLIAADRAERSAHCLPHEQEDVLVLGVARGRGRHSAHSRIV